MRDSIDEKSRCRIDRSCVSIKECVVVLTFLQVVTMYYGVCYLFDSWKFAREDSTLFRRGLIRQKVWAKSSLLGLESSLIELESIPFVLIQ